MYGTDFWTLWEKARVGCFKRTASKHVYYLGWNRSPGQVGCMGQALRPGALGRPRGIGWRGRWEGGSGWGTHVNPWLIHFSVWQNPLQYCKVISLQLIKKKIKKMNWVNSVIEDISCTLLYFSEWGEPEVSACLAAWKRIVPCIVVVQLLSSVQLFYCSLPGSSVHSILQARILGLHFPSSGNLPDLWIKPVVLALAGRFFTTELPGKPLVPYIVTFKSEGYEYVGGGDICGAGGGGGSCELGRGPVSTFIFWCNVCISEYLKIQLCNIHQNEII